MIPAACRTHHVNPLQLRSSRSQMTNDIKDIRLSNPKLPLPAVSKMLKSPQKCKTTHLNLLKILKEVASIKNSMDRLRQITTTLTVYLIPNCPSLLLQKF